MAIDETNDYCDLDPTKICDNCCKCIESTEEYSEYGIELTDKIEQLEEAVLPFDWEEVDWDGESEIDDSHVDPLNIDSRLMAEWEEKLRKYEETQQDEGKEPKGLDLMVELDL